jgi:hypothetical protein
MPCQEHRAKLQIWRIFNTMIVGQHFLILLRKLMFLVTFMQKKFLNRVLYKENKRLMLESYWDMKLREITNQARESKNKQMIKLCKNINDLVLPEIKSYVLKKFLE